MCPVQYKACAVMRVAGKCQAYEREPQCWVEMPRIVDVLSVQELANGVISDVGHQAGEC